MHYMIHLKYLLISNNKTISCNKKKCLKRRFMCTHKIKDNVVYVENKNKLKIKELI